MVTSLLVKCLSRSTSIEGQEVRVVGEEQSAGGALLSVEDLHRHYL